MDGQTLAFLALAGVVAATVLQCVHLVRAPSEHPPRA